MCNLSPALISWRQGVLEVKCLEGALMLSSVCGRVVREHGPAWIDEVVMHIAVTREMAGSHAGQMLTFLQE